MKKGHSVDMLAAVILMFLFLLTGACSLALGVRTWRSVEAQMEQAFARHTPLSYISGKVRQSEKVYVDYFADGTQALGLMSTWGGDPYMTLLYCYDGKLYELFSPADVMLTPVDGLPLLEIDALEVTAEDGLFRVHCTTTDGVRNELLLAAKGEGAVS